MAQPQCILSFLDKTAEIHCVVRKFKRQYLQRDQLTGARIARTVDDRHAATANLG